MSCVVPIDNSLCLVVWNRPDFYMKPNAAQTTQLKKRDTQLTKFRSFDLTEKCFLNWNVILQENKLLILYTNKKIAIILNQHYFVNLSNKFISIHSISKINITIANMADTTFTFLSHCKLQAPCDCISQCRTRLQDDSFACFSF